MPRRAFPKNGFVFHLATDHPTQVVVMPFCAVKTGVKKVAKDLKTNGIPLGGTKNAKKKKSLPSRKIQGIRLDALLSTHLSNLFSIAKHDNSFPVRVLIRE